MTLTMRFEWSLHQNLCTSQVFKSLHLSLNQEIKDRKMILNFDDDIIKILKCSFERDLSIWDNFSVRVNILNFYWISYS